MTWSRNRFTGTRASNFTRGKTCVWNRSGTVPDNVDSLGEEVWRTDGIKVLIGERADLG